MILDILVNLLSGGYFLVGYVVNGNVFPQPLTEGEERDLFERFHLGDLAAKSELISRNLRLVVHLLKKFNLQEDLDDLISIGTVGLIKAIENFDYTLGRRLSSYAARCIENEVLMYIRSTRKTKAEVYLEDPIGIDKEGNQINLLDVLGTDHNLVHDEVENKISTSRVFVLMDLILTDRERLVIQLRYGLNGEPRTQIEIANSLDISRSYVSRIEKKALNKLKKQMSSS